MPSKVWCLFKISYTNNNSNNKWCSNSNNINYSNNSKCNKCNKWIWPTIWWQWVKWTIWEWATNPMTSPNINNTNTCNNNKCFKINSIPSKCNKTIVIKLIEQQQPVSINHRIITTYLWIKKIKPAIPLTHWKTIKIKNKWPPTTIVKD